MSEVNRLTFIMDTGKTDNRRCRIGLYMCWCGNIVELPITVAKNNRTRSCGCARKEYFAQNPNGLTHGESMGAKRSAEYGTWSNMLTRCRNPKSKAFKDYGGRGVEVCERWTKFELFLEDMGRKPGANFSLDRIDYNGNYCPDNCRWADNRTQANNKRSNRFLEAYGEKLTIAEWARVFEVPQHRIINRLRYGYDEHRALFEPVRTWQKEGAMKELLDRAREFCR